MTRSAVRARLHADLLTVLATVTATLIFTTALYYSYKTVIAPAYSYMGLTYRPPTHPDYLVAVMATVLVTLILPRRILHTSDFMLWVFFIVAGAPAILVSQYSLVLSPDEATRMGLAVAGCMVMIRAGVLLRPRGVMLSLKLPSDVVWAGIVVVAGVIYAYLVLFVGLRFHLLALADVYDVREEFSTVAVPYVGYLVPALHNVINPLLMARGVYACRALPFLAGAAGQVLIYMTTGKKSVLFSVVAILAAAWLFRRNQRFAGHNVLSAVTVGIAGALVIDKLTGSIVLSSLFVRRFVVVSGILTAAYVAIFSTGPKTNFSDSVLFWLDNPYTINPVHIVGAMFGGNIESAANVSLFGHGYLNFGYLGMFVEAAILVVVLWLVDDATRTLPTPVASLIFLMPTVALASSSVFTAILTHGLLAAVAVCALLPATGWGRRRAIEHLGNAAANRATPS